ncbi:MAG TPA: Crp/Fnr family transcriptional regulator [Deltaproteobacteria bacterium]|nr:Crp/Fnr family transcriptional regulator [Deltaproteobacteria bacterium]
MDRAKASFLGRAALLSHLPPPLLSRAVQRTAPVRVRRRRELWRVGDPAEHLYFVRSGVVRVGMEIGQGHALTLRFHGKGDVCGEVGALEAALGTPAARHTDAVAHEELVVYALPIEELQLLLEGFPGVVAELAGLVSTRRREVELRLGGLPFSPVPCRVASALLQLVEPFGVRDSRGIIINLRLTHRELAGLVGSTRETVSAILSELRRAGVLQIEGKRVVLLDTDALQARAEPPG